MILGTSRSAAAAALTAVLLSSSSSTTEAFSIPAATRKLQSTAAARSSYRSSSLIESTSRLSTPFVTRRRRRLSTLSVSTAPPPEELLSSSSATAVADAASTSSSTTTAAATETSSLTALPPPRDADTGVWNLATPDDHAALMAQSSDKLVILKVFAPWCRACKGLEPKFVQLSRDETNSIAQDGTTALPIEWASLSIQHNKAFVQSLGVLALPTIQFYVGGKLIDTFPCGPSKVPMLKRKLSALITDYVTYNGVLKPMEVAREAAEEAAAQAAASRKQLATATSATATSAPMVLTPNEVDPENVNGDGLVVSLPPTAAPVPTLTAAERDIFRSIPYFTGMSLADMDQVLDQAVELTFAPGSILVREGKPGRTFYVIKSGEVEICQQTWNYATQFADPMVQASVSMDGSMSSSKSQQPDAASGVYLGSVVNRLGPGDHFGERALITGEPRAASLRAAEDEPVTLWAIDQDVFPFSCVLSGKSRNTAQPTLLDQVNDKYGVNDVLELYRQQVLNKQATESATASQVRGSIHKPSALPGLLEDIDDTKVAELEDYVDSDFLPDATDEPGAAAAAAAAGIAIETTAPAGVGMVTVPNDDAIFSLLTRFQMIRHVSTCFKYIQKTRAVWGDLGSRKRRNMLVSRLSATQRTEFSEIFALMDVNGDGCLELNELKRLLDSIGDISSEELKSVLQVNDKNDDDCANADPKAIDVENCVGPGVMTYEDYMGIMAEAEFYYLFRDIFASLDVQGSGYVKASDLDRVLCGVRDLISDDRKSVIDVDDKDMLIDYEQFSRMLLGTTLI